MKQMTSIICAMALLLASSALSAEVYEGGAKQITLIRVDGGGVSIALSPAPKNCNGGSQYRMHARVYATYPNYNAMVSSLLALKTSHSPVKGLWFSNSNITCDAANILKITLIEY